MLNARRLPVGCPAFRIRRRFEWKAAAVTHVRRDINSLSESELDDYIHAINILRDRSHANRGDEAGFDFQAALHNDEFVGPCEHGSDLFLPWHQHAPANGHGHGHGGHEPHPHHPSSCTARFDVTSILASRGADDNLVVTLQYTPASEADRESAELIKEVNLKDIAQEVYG
jgi:hypothetical protein